MLNLDSIVSYREDIDKTDIDRSNIDRKNMQNI